MFDELLKKEYPAIDSLSVYEEFDYELTQLLRIVGENMDHPLMKVIDRIAERIAEYDEKYLPSSR